MTKANKKPAIRWDASDDDFRFVRKIVSRAMKINPELDRTELHMDLIATHMNGCPLQLDAMADPKVMDDFNFLHDIYGIAAHLNRETGQLERCFLPRAAA